ncbi:MAG TPA: hypothetical protein EYP56_01635, partial [Planctomycetaceae bacterium]|nr:hypothetical protein [Planctomycetaceae bacterium]
RRPQQGRGLLARLKQADRDGDGKISKEEAPEPLKQRFDRLDKDGNGLLDADELKQAFQGRRRRQP